MPAEDYLFYTILTMATTKKLLRAHLSGRHRRHAGGSPIMPLMPCMPS